MPETMQDIMNPGAASHDDRFPHAPSDWTAEDAERSASDEGLTMTDDHWEVIRSLQAYFFEGDAHPNTRVLHDALDEHFHSRGGLKYLYEIFPGGPVAQGCRLAGLKPPAGAVDSSFGSVK
ncbi:MAG: TusE/DsrC/DsvC family sulfur relay protein [Gammaproteobacteria bacterium]|jgi:tRNA 2-thiouridine synthesizing protein E|nr:TusE/DsrC/DsvC family sulfur relay protein [Gammaproteobacteria bacterium]